MCEFKPHEKFDDPDYQCRHPARQDGLCIFHLLKPTEEQKQAMAQEARTAAEAIEREFHQAFSKLLEDAEKNPEVEVCDFSYFRFPSIYLGERRFAKPLGLRGATFSGVAGFQRATFSGEANFQRATFSGEAHFWGATFSRGVGFWQATFSGEVDFREAIFREKASFWESTFSGKASFRGETFTDVCLFTSVTLNEKAEVVFEEAFFGKANLRQASFLDTNLERIHFRDMEWPRKGRRQG